MLSEWKLDEPQELSKLQVGTHATVALQATHVAAAVDQLNFVELQDALAEFDNLRTLNQVRTGKLSATEWFTGTSQRGKSGSQLVDVWLSGEWELPARENQVFG